MNKYKWLVLLSILFCGCWRQPIAEDPKPGLDYGGRKKPMILNEENFKQEVLEADVPVLVDFWAPWCGPCNALTPTIEQINEESGGRWKVGKVNTDENPQLSTKYRISSIPALLFFKDGEIKTQIVGIQPKSRIVDELEKLIDD